MLFTGEMVFPWMFEDVAALRPYREAANILAAKADWGPLYDTVALGKNTIPAAAATYVEVSGTSSCSATASCLQHL